MNLCTIYIHWATSLKCRDTGMDTLKCLLLRLLPVCLFAFFPICPSVQSQESTLDGLADDVAQQLKKAEKKHFSPKVLVIDFPLKPGGIKALGEYIADQLSDALAQKVGPAAVIDRKNLHSYLQARGISPFDLADREIAIWIAGEVGANAIVFGSVTPSNLTLTTDLIRIGDEKKIGSSKANLAANDQLKEMVSKPLDWPASSEAVVPCLSGSREEMADSFKAARLTMPTCIHCPNPEYTDEARAAKFNGAVKFDVMIDEQGRAKRIAVVKGDRHGLTARALQAIKEWQFKPSMKDGKPETVCVVIEVTFKIF
jgi:TonB family protein